MSWVAVGVAGTALVGGIIQSNASKNAANTQAGAAANAQQISQHEFNTITRQEQPYINSGYGAQEELNFLLGSGLDKSQRTHEYNEMGGAYHYGDLNKPFNVSDWKRLSPEYNFQKQQGMQGVLNGDASSEGALSGAAQKDLIGFNQGLANTSFNNAFNMYQAQQGNIYQRLAGISQLGQAAASNTGQQGTALAGQAAQSATNIGTAQAAGQIGSANAFAGALTNASYMPWLMGNGGMQQQAGSSAASGG